MRVRVRGRGKENESRGADSDSPTFPERNLSPPSPTFRAALPAEPLQIRMSLLKDIGFRTNDVIRSRLWRECPHPHSGNPPWHQ